MAALLLLAMSVLAEAASVKDFGAQGDGVTDDTAAVQAAIDACAAKGERLVFPSGTFLTGTVHLRSHTAIELTAKAVWKGLGRVDAYPVQNPKLAEGRITAARRALIFAEDIDHVSITGSGTLDGSGESAAFLKKPNHPDRPYGIWMVRCRDVRVEGIRMRNSAFWMQHYQECDYVRIAGIRVFNHANLNNDGLDITDCHNVAISDVQIDSSDDALCLKSEGDRMVSDVVISNCLLASHADALKLGTASRGGFRRIAVSNLVIRPSASDHIEHPMKVKGGLAGIDLMSTDGGTLEDILIRNVVMDGVETPFVIKLGDRWAKRSEGLPLNSNVSSFVTTVRDGATLRAAPGVVRNIAISHVIARRCGPVPSSITGYPGHPVENIVLSDMLIEIEGGRAAHDVPVPENSGNYPYNRIFGRELPAYAFFVRHATNVHFRNLQLDTIAGDERRAFVFTDAVATLDNIGIRNGGGGSRAPVLADQPGAVVIRGDRGRLSVEIESGTFVAPDPKKQ